MNYLLIIIIFLGLISCNNPYHLEDRWREYRTIVKHNQVNVFPEFSFEVKNQVDLVLAIDNSGSMQAEQQALGANFQNFISNLNERINIRIMIVSSDSSTPKGRGCYSRDHFPEIPDLISNIGVTGSNYEKPIKHGYAVFQNNPSFCFRENSYKYLLVLTDEDERQHRIDKSILPEQRQWYISEFLINDIKLHGVIQNGSYPAAIAEILNETGGTRYNIYGDYGTLMANFADDMNETVLDFAFTDTNPDHINPQSVYVFLKPEGSDTFESVPMDDEEYEIIYGIPSRIHIYDLASIEGFDGLKVKFDFLETFWDEDRIIELSTIPLHDDKIHVLVDGEEMNPDEYYVDVTIPAVVLEGFIEVRVGTEIVVRYI